MRTHLPRTLMRITTSEKMVQNQLTIRVGFISSLVCNLGGAVANRARIECACAMVSVDGIVRTAHQSLSEMVHAWESRLVVIPCQRSLLK